MQVRCVQTAGEWVNQSKRGGKDRVFRGLAGLLRRISRGRNPRKIPRSSPASPKKTLSFLTLLLRFTLYFKYFFNLPKQQQDAEQNLFVARQIKQILEPCSFCCIGLHKVHGWFCMDPPKWYIRFRMVPPQVFHIIGSNKISTVGEFWCTIAIMQDISYLKCNDQY